MVTRTLCLTVEYDGAAFKGWQVQSKGERTVQGELERVLSMIIGTPVRVIGSGRTDTGVHARGQTAHFSALSRLTPAQFMRALNNQLPADIVVTAVRQVPRGFHAQHHAKGKIYTYTLLNRAFPSAMDRGRVWWIARPLDLEAMKREARSLLGQHDFSSFANVDPDRRDDSIRILRRLDIASKPGSRIVVTFEGDGFLYKMVRNIMGTLVDVGLGRLTAGSLATILKARDRRAAGKAAPAQGLCLERVQY